MTQIFFPAWRLRMFCQHHQQDTNLKPAASQNMVSYKYTWLLTSLYCFDKISFVAFRPQVLQARMEDASKQLADARRGFFPTGKAPSQPARHAHKVLRWVRCKSILGMFMGMGSTFY
jgi:hypothetical protein